MNWKNLLIAIGLLGAAIIGVLLLPELFPVFIPVGLYGLKLMGVKLDA